ncbi:MAG: hypothetical protein LBH06_02925 [Rikenellaceae bacterium]|jgi:hypothetical protein|nr:hypothetical protein [Rikenellaceae bacterium]
MIRSELFGEDNRTAIENTIVGLLNTSRLMNSPRAVGDAVQSFLEQSINEWLPRDIVASTSTSFARRSMADLALEDVAGNYYVVDVKTHNLGTDFNMPNLTSVERLARLYGDNKNYFVLLLVS